VSEPALDRELVLTGLGLLADVATDTRRIVEILEELGDEEDDES